MECSAGEGPSSLSGNPCDVVTGEKFESETDYSSTQLTFTRSYHSMAALESASLGKGWTHNYAGYLLLTGSTPRSLVREHGFQETLSSEGMGVYVSVSASGIRVTAQSGGWVATLRNGTKEFYDGTGKLTGTATVAGLVTSLVYQGGKLASITGPHGHRLLLEYEGSRLARLRGPDNQSISYHYAANGNLTSVDYPDATTRTYHYEDSVFPTLLTGITSEGGVRYSNYTYDSFGRAISSERAGGAQRITLAYTPTSTTVTDSALGTTTYTLSLESLSNGPRRIAGINRNGLTESFQREIETGRIKDKTDSKGIVTHYTYDTLDPLTKTEAFGTPRARTTTTQRHATYRLPTQIDEPGRRTTFTYDTGGDLLTKTVLDTTTSASKTWTYTYNSYGQVLTADGPRTDVSDVTTYTYYTCTTGYQCGQVHTITNALGHLTTYNTYNAHGQPLTITDPNGVVTTLTYDLRQRLTSRTVGSEQTSFTYWPTGLLKKATLPDGSYLEYTYDAAHRLTGINDAEGNRVDYTLDAMGNRTAEQAYDPSNALTQTRTRVFNTLNQLWKEIGAAGTANVTTEYGYDNNGNQTSINAPLTRNTTQAYDELNRLTQVTDPLLGITRYGYNPLDQLISVTDPKGLVTRYEYNALGDLRKQTSPDSGVTNYTHDAAGNVATQTDARGQAGTHSYDALNRLTYSSYSDQTITRSYDDCPNGVGRLCSIADGSGAVTDWTYTPQGRVSTKVQGAGQSEWTVSYGYDAAGQMTSQTLPSGAVVSYGYTHGRVTSIHVTVDGVSTPVLDNVVYHPFGDPYVWDWGNNTAIRVREQDTDGRVSLIDSAGQFSYAYDHASRITGITDTSTPSRSWTYGYDLLDRLKSESRTGWSLSFAYDANGNRLSQTGTPPNYSWSSSYSNPLTSNRLLATYSGNRAYSYDAAGNVTQIQQSATYTHSYDAAGRRIALNGGASSTNGGLTYAYNGIGQMVRKYQVSQLTPVDEQYVYDEQAHLLGIYGVNYFHHQPIAQQEIIWLGDIPVAVLMTRDVWGWDGDQQVLINTVHDLLYIHTDHLNTPRRLTRPSDNAIVWRWDSDAFGMWSDAPNPNPDGDNRYYVFSPRMPGQIHDVQAGLFQNGYRDYDYWSGRYIQSDPIGLAGGINTYAYVRVNPLSLIDPYGLYCLSPQAINAIAGAVGGAFSGAIALSEVGPVGVIAGATLGGFFGGGFGYFSTSSSTGQSMAIGGASSFGSGFNDPIGSIAGGIVGGAVTSELQSQGVPDNISGPVGGGIGGASGGAIATIVSRGGPSSVSRSIVAAIRAGRLGGLAGLSGAALSAAVAEALKAGNECEDCSEQ